LEPFFSGEIVSHNTDEGLPRDAWHTLFSTPKGEQWLQEISQKHKVLALADRAHHRGRLYHTGTALNSGVQEIIDVIGKKVGFSSVLFYLLWWLIAS
jgi:hypothetical protein